jgi:hypothetical protein
MDTAKDKIEEGKDAVEPGPVTTSRKELAKEGMKDDVRNTVSSLLNAMEDVMHQLTESAKQRKVGCFPTFSSSRVLNVLHFPLGTFLIWRRNRYAGSGCRSSDHSERKDARESVSGI